MTYKGTEKSGEEIYEGLKERFGEKAVKQLGVMEVFMDEMISEYGIACTSMICMSLGASLGAQSRLNPHDLYRLFGHMAKRLYGKEADRVVGKADSDEAMTLDKEEMEQIEREFNDETSKTLFDLEVPGGDLVDRFLEEHAHIAEKQIKELSNGGLLKILKDYEPDIGVVNLISTAMGLAVTAKMPKGVIRKIASSVIDNMYEVMGTEPAETIVSEIEKFARSVGLPLPEESEGMQRAFEEEVESVAFIEGSNQRGEA